jgi:hypothetical protein
MFPMAWYLPLHAFLWAQAPGAAATAAVGPAGPASVPPTWLRWMFVWGDPAFTIQEAPWGGLMTWCKVVGLFCLLGWVLSWLFASMKDDAPGRGGFRPIDAAGLIGVIAALVAALSSVALSAQSLPASFRPLPTAAGLVAAVLVVLWIEVKLWSILRRRGTNQDRVLLVALHLAVVMGFVLAFLMRAYNSGLTLTPTLMQGGRFAATYMGLVVLARVAALIIPEILRLRWRRLFAIAWLCWTEAFRRMWAPWVVVIVFGVILAFTSWFLQPPRPAEMSQLYVGTLMLLTSILLTLAVVILAPISIPNDVRQQTIFTTISKPVRRLEMIWGRILGYMALVTVLLLLFGGISLLYFERQISAAQREVNTAADQAEKDGKVEMARNLREQSSQLTARMSARSPITGSLIFFDSRDVQRRRGVDVGIELPGRSFVEGATPARAIWRFGPNIPNPLNPQEIQDRTIPVEQLLTPNTIEWVDDRILNLRDQVAANTQRVGMAQLSASQIRELPEATRAAEDEIKTLQAQRTRLLEQEKTLTAQNTPASLEQARRLHSPDVKVEMVFTVYRTTKGVLGEPVYAQLTVRNPRPGVDPYSDIIDIREYYTNKRTIPARVLAGSRGQLEVEIRCLTPSQYLGMAEGDLYLLASEGRFWTNYLRGLTGIWLQAMILTAIGVCAGTFLSWPVALLTTLFFFIAGNAGFTTLQQLALSSELVGGGPFEALIRTLTHENLVTELDPTPAVMVAKTFDSVLTPIMSRLVYIVPNFTALDASETVATGFALSWSRLGGLVLLAFAYALPFSLAAYFILKQREVAA